MKIVGITYYDGEENIVLKSDSSLLVNRKPLFVPESVHELQALPCIVLRVSRLGKCIAPRFASRYYDAVAPGLDFFAADKLREAKAAGKPWTQAIAFENSLAVGEWEEIDRYAEREKTAALKEESLITSQWLLERDGGQTELMKWEMGGQQEVLDDAIARASELLTIRQGDMIYVAIGVQPWQLQSNDLICCADGEKEQLYCKIK